MADPECVFELFSGRPISTSPTGFALLKSLDIGENTFPSRTCSSGVIAGYECPPMTLNCAPGDRVKGD